MSIKGTSKGGGRGSSEKSLANLRNKNNANTYSNAKIVKYGTYKDDFNESDVKNALKAAGVPNNINGEIEVLASNKNKLHIEVKNKDLEIISNVDFASKTINNKSFTVKNKDKYSGSEIFKKQAEEASKQGFKYIETKAAKSSKYNGYYTWARLGFEPVKNDISMEVAIERYNQKYKQKAKKLSDIMETSEGRKYWRENGVEFNGIFDLSKNSESMKILKSYKKGQ